MKCASVHTSEHSYNQHHVGTFPFVGVGAAENIFPPCYNSRQITHSCEEYNGIDFHSDFLLLEQIFNFSSWSVQIISYTNLWLCALSIKCVFNQCVKSEQKLSDVVQGRTSSYCVARPLDFSQNCTLFFGV